MADRQIGPAILRHGTPELQRRYLPRIAAGQVTFCLGMSETEAGSDLPAVCTVATAVTDGWQITGRKIWTSHAHRSTHAYVLTRTDRAAEQHAGLTEFIVDMTAAGVDVRPILDMQGEHHFNEVVLEDVPVPDDHVLGQVGNGRRQVTEQLAFERGGMERVLSTYPLLAAAVTAASDHADFARTGRALALLATLRRPLVTQRSCWPAASWPHPASPFAAAPRPSCARSSPAARIPCRWRPARAPTCARWRTMCCVTGAASRGRRTRACGRHCSNSAGREPGAPRTSAARAANSLTSSRSCRPAAGTW
jgi:alkylation response protein AidB-like acyl-CoA dehydrogenase